MAETAASRPLTKAGSKLKPPSVFRCGLTLSAVKLSLKVLGFARTIGWIRHRVQTACQATSVDSSDVKRAERAVAMVSAFHPGRAKCLEQSLTLYYILRRQGVAVEYCQGVAFHPFQAHAWIEYGGEVVNDVPEHVRHFARFQGLLP